MKRMLISLPLAIPVTLCLFYLLVLITNMGKVAAPERELTPALDFLMVRHESEVQLRQRQLPPEPDKVVEQQPQIPQMQPMESPPISTDMPQADLPSIEMGVAVSLSSLAMPMPAMAIDTNPTIVSQVPPQYPHKALRRRQEGHVIVEFMIDKSGAVKAGSVVIIESTPPEVFDREVLRVIQRWRFKTRLVNGQPVAYKARQRLEFQLEK